MQQPDVSEQPQPAGVIDVLIIAALLEEWEAARAVDAGALGPWQSRQDSAGFEYVVRAYEAAHGPIRVALARATSMAGAAAATVAARLVTELRPRCLAMCGVCAGRRGDIALGDVIIADRVFQYDYGKLKVADGGQQIFNDLRTLNLDARFKQAAERFDPSDLELWASATDEQAVRWLLERLAGGDDPRKHPARARYFTNEAWRATLGALQDKALIELQGGRIKLTEAGQRDCANHTLLYPDAPDTLPFAVAVGPIASGNQVVSDPQVWQLIERYERKVLGLEMEGAAIGMVAHIHDLDRFVIAKGVMDHGDQHKDDRYKAFAARASAEVLLSFLRKQLGMAVDIAVSPDPLAAVASELAEAIARQERLREAGGDSSRVDREIVALKSRLRRGGVLKPGDVLRHEGQQRYVLLNKLGQGGFANVWSARDRSDDSQCAVKVLHSQFAEDRTRRERFFRGAREMAKLQHEAIVRVQQPHAEDEGFHYFVMELMEGGDLKRAVLEGRIERDAVVPLILALGEALEVAHQAGLVHRDVKPANVLLDSQRRPKLTDFDLVGGAHTTGGTRTGALGTFLFAPPEMMHRPQDADIRADVFSLGMTTLFALRREELTMHILRSTDRVIASLPCAEGIKAVITRAIEWEIESRYPTVSAYCEALRAASAEAASGIESSRMPDAVSVATQGPGLGLAPVRRHHAAVDGDDDVWASQDMRRWARTSGDDEYGRWATLVVAGVVQRMRWIPPGSFMMGSPDHEVGRQELEGPQHSVLISRGFWLAETPCTQALWKAVMGSYLSHFKGEEHPADNMNVRMIDVFFRHLKRFTRDVSFHLLNEAQWEYACRAGAMGRRYQVLGEEEPATLDEIAWWRGNSDNSTHPVASKHPNAWGLYDMLGNVWEWCADDMRPYADEQELIVDPVGYTDDTTYRTIRGGAWDDEAENIRAASRFAFHPQDHNSHVGFRLARSRPAEVSDDRGSGHEEA